MKLGPCALWFATLFYPCSPAIGQDILPNRAIAFFDRERCPQGWESYAPARGRTVLPAGPEFSIGGLVGEPLGPGEAPAHGHSLEVSVRLGSAGYYQGLLGDGYPHAFLRGGSPRGKAVTEIAESNLPVLKLLVCQKAAVPDSGLFPTGLTAFFDQPSCPQGWARADTTTGRFVVGLPPEGKAAAIFGSDDPLKDLEDRAHGHSINGTIAVPRDVIGTGLCTYCDPQKDALDISPGGRSAYSGEAFEASSGLPYIQLLQCVKEGPAAPQVNSIVHAATFTAGPAAPGQIVTIFGAGMAGPDGVFAQLDQQGRVATQLAGVSVKFDEFAGPLFFVRQDQINVQVPYGVAGRDSVTVRVFHDGVAGNEFKLAVTSAAPGLFTRQDDPMLAVAVHSDGSLNSTFNPAGAGDIIVLFATGEGQTTPPGEDGKLAAAPLPTPLLDVSVWIAGVQATVEFAGSAPGFAGLMQLNVRVPPASGSVAVQLQVGLARSNPGVEIFTR